LGGGGFGSRRTAMSSPVAAAGSSVEFLYNRTGAGGLAAIGFQPLHFASWLGQVRTSGERPPIAALAA
jgi:hypothetical protein